MMEVLEQRLAFYDSTLEVMSDYNAIYAILVDLKTDRMTKLHWRPQSTFHCEREMHLWSD